MPNTRLGMRSGTCSAIVALIAMTGTVLAQPRPEAQTSSENKKEEGAEAKIPIAVPDTGEVLGGNLLVPAVAPVAPLAIEHPIDPETYVCGTGDVFELDFWGAQNFRITIAADLEGRAFIAKVGFVPVAGKTLAAVRATMKARVKTLYPGLTFDLTLVSPRTFRVHVADNVKHPGGYPARALDRVSSVIGKAGGTTGSRRRIAIQHRDGTTSTADLVRYELTGDVAYDPLVLDGDVITVPIAMPVVAIAGPVHRPGRYELVASKDIAELLDLAGGFTSEVNRSLAIRLLRRNGRQQLATTELPFADGAAPNAPLDDDDEVVVRSIEELQRSVLIIGAVVGADPLDPATTSRRVPYVDGDTVMSLIERAGGIKAPGDLRRSYISRSRPGQPPELIPLDLEALLVHRDFAADRPVKMDDTIVVPPMLYSVLVEGAVAHAGLYNYNPTFGVPEYVARAGGRTRTAREIEDVQLIDAAGHTHPFRAGVMPGPGDAILVPERNFSRAEITQLVLAGAGIVLSGIAVAIAASR